MPPFLKEVFDSKERLRFYSTIQSQVEVQLDLHLGLDQRIPICRQTTRAIMEKILESEELAKVNLAEHHHFFGLTKTSTMTDQRDRFISFFSRATAVRLKDVRILNQGRVYSLTNAHCPQSGSTWRAHQGPTGRSWQQRAEYTIILQNLTRFDEIGRVEACLNSRSRLGSS